MTELRARASQELVAAGSTLLGAGFIGPTGHANLSSRFKGDMLLTSGSVQGMTTEDVALVSLSGEVRSGWLAKLNADVTQMHAEVYRILPNVNAIVHSHPRDLLAFALANKPLPVNYEPMLRIGQEVPVPVVPWFPRGSPAAISGIARCLSESPDTKAVLLGNHGVLVFGQTVEEAVIASLVLEEAARAELVARVLGGSLPLSDGPRPGSGAGSAESVPRNDMALSAQASQFETKDTATR